MNTFKKSILSLKRKKTRSLTLLAIISLVILTVATLFSLNSAIAFLKKQMINQVPTVVTLEYNIGEAERAVEKPEFISQIPLEKLEKIAALPMVSEHDFIFREHVFSMHYHNAPLQIDQDRIPGNANEGALRHMTQGARTRGAQIDVFNVKGIINPHITDIGSGLITLVSGRTFTDAEINNDKKVIIVSRCFAIENELGIGDFLHISNIAFDYSRMNSEGTGIFEMDRHLQDFWLDYENLSFEIIGLFETAMGFDYSAFEGWDLISALGDRFNLLNRFYVPIGVAESMTNFIIRAMTEEQRISGTIADKPYMTALFLINDPRNLESFSLLASDILPDFWQARDFSNNIVPIVSAFNSFENIISTVTFGSIGFAVLILVLVVAMHLRERRYEIAIYKSLGQSNFALILQLLAEITILTILAFILSFLFSDVASRTISETLIKGNFGESVKLTSLEGLPMDLALFNQSSISVDEILANNEIGLSTGEYLMIMLFAAISILGTVCTILAIVIKKSPNDILLQNHT